MITKLYLVSFYNSFSLITKLCLVSFYNSLFRFIIHIYISSHRYTLDTPIYCAIFTWHSKLHSAMEEDAFAVPALPDTVLICSPSHRYTLDTPIYCAIFTWHSYICLFTHCYTRVMRHFAYFSLFFHYFGKLLRHSVHTRPVQKRKIPYRSTNDAFLYTLGLHRRRWMSPFWYYN